MAKVFSFLKTMPNARVFHYMLKFCCERFIPFHYDPATKVFSAYPICEMDLDFMISSFEFACNGLFNPDSNR